MTLAYRNDDMLRMVDASRGTVDRRIFSDPDIYQMEMERIFARSWNFMCHDSQIPSPGDFFMTYIGEDRVIVVRDNDGMPQVLINSCRHRGNAVCRAEEGHATSFMCTYHGWTYDLKGALVGVPGFKEVYHEELDRENWGLIKAAQVDSYRGYVFANMDADAPPLMEYLGDVGKLSIDLQAQRGTMKIIGGIQKNVIPCNWKLAADNVWDWYHPGLAHASATMSGYNFSRRIGPGQDKPLTPEEEEQLKKRQQRNSPQGRMKIEHFVSLGDYGHAISGPAYDPENPQQIPGIDMKWRETEETMKLLGPKAGGHPHIFPNMWITGFQISVRMPKGPSHTEIWWFTFKNLDAPEDEQELSRHRSNHTFGAAGMLEQEDGENWGESTKAAHGVVSSRFPLNYTMNLGNGEVIRNELTPAPYILPRVNENAQLWLYRAWADWMASDSWDDLRANRSQLGDVV
jgi:phenylpropionate dioxygenase-like ring-hydroxylating dioxygenase large terminal subunit